MFFGNYGQVLIRLPDGNKFFKKLNGNALLLESENVCTKNRIVQYNVILGAVFEFHCIDYNYMSLSREKQTCRYVNNNLECTLHFHGTIGTYNSIVRSKLG